MLPGLLLTACVNTTGGDRIAFHARVAPDLPDPTWVDEGTGWTITLDEATAWVGPIYLWSEEPRLDPNALGRLWRAVVAEARAADPFEAGYLRGEVVGQVQVDLLGDPVDLPDGSALAGPSRSGELWLEPPLDPRAETLAWAGVAARDGVTVPFAGAITWEDGALADPTDNPVALRRLRGLLWDATLSEGGTLTLSVDPRRWFDGVDFATLAAEPTDEAGRHPMTPTSDAGRVLSSKARRVGATGPWSLRFDR